VVHVNSRQAGRLGAHAHDQVVVRVALVANHDGIGLDIAMSADDVDLVAPAGRLGAASHLEDDLLLALHHAREVHADVANLDAELSGPTYLPQEVCPGEQRLGWDAAPVEARAPELSSLDESDLRTELGATKRRDISGRPSAQDHDPGHYGTEPPIGRVVSSATVSALRKAVVTIRSCSS